MKNINRGTKKRKRVKTNRINQIKNTYKDLVKI